MADVCPECNDTGYYRDPSSGRLNARQECNYCTSAERRERASRMITISVRYSCKRCDVKDEKLDVPARPKEGMDVRVWMDHTLRHIARDHRRKYPFCRAKTLQDLKIPIENAEWVGGPALQ